jgi:hypothetical protein
MNVVGVRGYSLSSPSVRAFMVSDPIISVTGSASAGPKSEFCSAPTHGMLQVNLRHLADKNAGWCETRPGLRSGIFFVDTKAIGLQSMGFGVVPQIKGKHMHF